ncbi:hypothetical protein D3C72_2509680 [compost metagenome]
MSKSVRSRSRKNGRPTISRAEVTVNAAGMACTITPISDLRFRQIVLGLLTASGLMLTSGLLAFAKA